MVMQDNLDAETPETALERRDILLKGVDRDSIKKAWFILSHLLLDENARVVHMGSGDGTVTYAMAAMAPKIRFVGLDKSKRQINRAREKFHLHNLEYKIGDASSEIFEQESLDAIINSYVLHEVYSASRYNERIVSDALRRQFGMLKKGGAMFIQDYASPPPGEYVLLELPDLPSVGEDLAGLSDADLLVWYSQYARPKQDPGCSGFFLEELPARFPKTRLFRLPHKWAYEFLMRKNDRAHWETEMPMEYTFFTMQDFRRELRALGARAQYSGPHWDEDLIEKRVGKEARLFDDSGAEMGPPPTCFIAVAYKMAERKSLNIEERRPSASEDMSFKITAMRDEKTGKLSDIVTRGQDISEIIPYRVDDERQLKIYLHDGVVKSIANAVPRSGMNLDGREWSGHMVEPVALESHIMESYDSSEAAKFCADRLSLQPENDAVIERGPEYYPAPDYIDERASTFYVRVKKSSGAVEPHGVIGHDDRFEAKGILREFDAQQVLNAIGVGMIPNARLELQILALFSYLNLKAENWTDKKIKLETGAITADKSLRKILDSYDMDSKRFREMKGSSGQLRGVHSTFVEEGQSRGAVTGLAAQDVDFVIYQDRAVNTAVILPLTKGMKGEIHAAFHLDQTPAPERREGNGLTASAITLSLPADIADVDQARRYVAEKYSVLPEMVLKMGECYFTHIGLTPQKIYPFAVAAPPKFFNDPSVTSMPLYQIMLMWQSFSRAHKTEGSPESRKRLKFTLDTNLLATMSRAYRFLHIGLDLHDKLKVQAIVKERMGYQGPDWGIPMTYREAPIHKQGLSSAMAAPKPGSMGLSPEWGAGETAAAYGKYYHAQSKEEEAPETKPPSVIAPPGETALPELPAVAATEESPSSSLPTGLPSLLADFENELKNFYMELEGADLPKPAPREW